MESRIEKWFWNVTEYEWLAGKLWRYDCFIFFIQILDNEIYICIVYIYFFSNIYYLIDQYMCPNCEFNISTQKKWHPSPVKLMSRTNLCVLHWNMIRFVFRFLFPTCSSQIWQNKNLCVSDLKDKKLLLPWKILFQNQTVLISLSDSQGRKRYQEYKSRVEELFRSIPAQERRTRIWW